MLWDSAWVSANPAAAPSGVVTFMFTDVEGSTRRWENDAEGMRAALAAHDEVLRKGIEAHGGFMFKHTGDGVCAAFASPMGAAAPSQRTIGPRPSPQATLARPKRRGQDIGSPPARGSSNGRRPAQRETAVHVEFDLAVREHMRPEKRGQAALVLGGEHAVPARVGQDVLDHEHVVSDGLPTPSRRWATFPTSGRVSTSVQARADVLRWHRAAMSCRKLTALR